MASNSAWLGKLKTRAKSVQETAKTRLEKLSETVDKKLKEAQEDLEKQRAKAEASASLTPHLQRWRPSADNPDGQLITEAKPPPVVQSTTPTPPESPQAPQTPPAPAEEPITIRHKGKKHSSKRNSPLTASLKSVDPESDSTNEQKHNHIKQSNNREEDTLSANDVINQTTDQDIVDKSSNELIDKISTTDELVKNTTFNATPQKQELIPVQNATNHLKDNTDKEKEESISLKTELYQENIQMNISTDKLTSMTNSDHLPDTRPDSRNISKNITHDEITVLTSIDKSSTEYSRPETIPINTPDNEVLSTPNIDDSSIEHSGSEYISIIITHDDLPVDDSGLEDNQMKISDDERPTLTNIDKSPIESSKPENIPINTSVDEKPTTTTIADSPIVNSGAENSPVNISDDEPPTLTNIDNPPNAHSTPKNIPIEVSDDELSISINSKDSPIEHSGPKNILINTPDDESSATTDIAHSPIVNSRPENIPINIPNDNNDEPVTLTDIDDSSMVDSGSKNISMKIPADELPVLMHVNEIPIVHPGTRDIQINTPDDESRTLTHIDDTPIEHSESEDELPTLTNDIEPQIKHSDLDENHSMISENNIKTPPNELEDSFGELKVPNTPIHRPPEEPRPKLTHLAALREFISKIEGEGDDDEELVSSKQNNNILEKNVDTTPEQIHAPNLIKNILSSSPSTSISDDPLDDIMIEAQAQNNSLNDELSNDEINESSSIMPIENTIPIEKKRFPVVNCHSIPPGTKVNHINCSSTYIYICTTDRKIFYAKLNLKDIDDPFKWQQHSDLAERIVVSVSNRTVWRLLNKHLYTSNDPIKFPPIGSQWNEMKINNGQALLSMSITDQCGWYIKEDGSLWLIRTDDQTTQPLNVTCPFNINTVFCFSEKVGVATSDGEILIRVGCTNDCLEGDGWIFIEHNFGPIDDFILLTNNNIITFVDKKHHFWIHQWPSEKGFYEILCNDEFFMAHQRYLISVNSDLLCITDCEEQIHIFSDCLTGVQWTVIEKNTRLQRLIGAFSNEDYVWALTTDKMICSSNGHVLEKPREAQYLTHATFVPNNSSQDTVLWSLDESCSIYVRASVENNAKWEQVDRSQFEWNRRLVNIVCNHAGVWAVDDQGCIYFRHGHISASQTIQLDELSILPPAWIQIPGEAKRHRCFSQVYCGPADWMVYATDNKQNVYTREGINEENRIGTSWKLVEDCSAIELAISNHTLWLLTSHGNIQCRENISLTNPIGTRSTTLSGLFLSLTVSMDDSQVWALDSKRNLLKLDRFTVLFEK